MACDVVLVLATSSDESLSAWTIALESAGDSSKFKGWLASTSSPVSSDLAAALMSFFNSR